MTSTGYEAPLIVPLPTRDCRSGTANKSDGCGNGIDRILTTSAKNKLKERQEKKN